MWQLRCELYHSKMPLSKCIRPVYLSMTHSPLIKFYRILGFSLDSTKRPKQYLIFFLFFFRLLTIVIFEIVSAVHYKAQVVEFLSNTSIFLYPFVEFSYLFCIHSRLSLKLNRFVLSFNLTHSKAVRVQSLLRKTSIVSLVIIIIQSITQFFIALPEFMKSRGWMVGRNFPVATTLGFQVESIISLTIYTYEAVVVTYIPLSASLYIFYLTIIMCLKQIAVEQIPSCTIDEALKILAQLDDSIDCFEDHLSILPFNWLGFCLGPGLCYLLLFITSNAVLLENTIEISIQVYIQICNIILTLIVLFIISKWQEVIEKSVDKVTRSLERAVTSSLHLRVLERVEKVVKRPVTIWFICHINRSLILAYIGSAITFSTLFIQLQR